MTKKSLINGIRSFGLVGLLVLGLGCSDKSTGPSVYVPGSGGSTPAEIPGKGTPPASKVELDIVSDSLIITISLDTIAINTLANANYDTLLDTLIGIDSLVIIGTIKEKPLFDTTLVLDSLTNRFIITGIPPGIYDITQKVKGDFEDFYTDGDTTLFINGSIPIGAIPVAEPVSFGSIDGFVYSSEDSTPLFNTIRVEFDPDNLDGNNKVSTDSTGYFLISYVPLEAITLTIVPKDFMNDSLYKETEITITLNDTARITQNFYLGKN